MNITKKMQSEMLKEELDCSRAMAIRFLDAFEALILRETAAGHTIKIKDIGRIKSIYREGRKYRDPSTGGTIYKEGKNIIKFDPSIELEEAIN